MLVFTALPPLAGSLIVLAAIAAALLLIGLVVWARRDRAFHSTASVADAYDRWTDDQLLERLWGDHVHQARSRVLKPLRLLVSAAASR